MPSITKKLDEKRYGPKDHNKIEAMHRRRIGLYFKDVVYASNDGIITTFAVIAAVVGASLSSGIIIIVGFANLLADGLSMAIGNYLGSRSERHWKEEQRKIEQWEVDNIPDVEQEELRTIYKRKGFEGELLDEIVDRITNDKELWVNEMLVAEHGVIVEEESSPIAHALATFIAFSSAGVLPIIPFLVLNVEGASFFWASVFTGVGLFVVGALRSLVTVRHWWLGGLEMLALGSVAAVVAYVVGGFAGSFF